MTATHDPREAGGVPASAARSAVASVSAEAGGRPQGQRRPRVVFHVTGFGVFGGVRDNPTTHLVGELPAELDARRSVRHDDYHGHDRRRRCGGGVEFEVRSCNVLDVSAKVGGQQLRELHAACSASSRRSRERAAASVTVPPPGSATAVGSSISNISAEHSVGNNPGATAAENGADCGGGGGGGAGGRSADEGGGPGETRPGQEGGGGGGGSPGNSTVDSGAISVAGGDGLGVGGDEEEEEDEDGDPITVFVHCGVNGGARKFALETRGFNEATFRIPDEQGDNFMHVPVEEENPDIRHCRVTTVPVGEVLSRLESMGWGPEHIEESRDAGRFVCNYVYYLSLGLSEKSAPRVGVGAPGTADGGGNSVGRVEEGARGEGGEGVSDAQGGRGSGRTGSAGGDSERGEQAPEGSVAPTGCTRHSLFIHVPPFKVVPKEKQLALLVACLSAIAASLASRASPTPRRSGSGTERAPTGLGTSATADAAGPAGPAQPAAASAGAPVAPLLSLSSYEAAVLAAADPEAVSPERANMPTPPNADTELTAAERAAATSPGQGSTIWDREASAENLMLQAAAAAAARESESSGGSDHGDGGGTQRTVQFALEALADEGGVGDQGEGGELSGEDEGESAYYRGEIGVDGGEGARALDRPEDGHRGDPAPSAADEEEEEEESPADATRRRLVQAGFDGLDVDAAMATTGSDNTEVNMQFLLDVTPLLPHGAPAEALSLLEQHRGSDSPAPLGGGGGSGSGERGRGEAPTHGHHARNGSGGGAMSAWPRVRGAISPAAMGGVSPKWIGDVSPARDDPDRANKPSSLTSSSGGGGLLSRFRRGHRRTRSTASAASDAPATEVAAGGGAGGRGERSPDKGASPPTASSRTRSSSTSSPPAAREYARRTTAHAARSHSPPPARGVGIFGAGNRSGRAVGDGTHGPFPPRRKSASNGSGVSGGGGSRDDGWGEVLSSGPNLRLALLVRLDLGMTTGMLAAQCSRAALAAAQKAEGSGRADTLAVWREAGESIVVLGAGNATSLDTILTIGAAHHLPITMVRDKQAAWVGNLGADNCSVAAIGPAPMSALRSVAGSLRVL